MSNAISDELLKYAIESGEIDPDAPVEGDVDPTEDLNALTEAKADEIVRATELTASLEALAERYSRFEINEATMESYHFTINHLLRVSGINVPTSVFAPSFESAEKAEDTKKSMGEKAKGAVSRIIAWIREKFNQLLNLFRRNKTNADKDKAEVVADHEKAKAAILAIKHEQGGQRRDFTQKPVEDEKQSPKHGDQNGDSSLPKDTIKVRQYKWAVVDGKFVLQKYKDLIKQFEEGPIFDIITKQPFDGDDLKKIIENASDKSRKTMLWTTSDFPKIWKENVSDKTLPSGWVLCECKISDLEEGLEISKKAVDAMVARISETDSGLKVYLRILEGRSDGDYSEEKKREIRNLISNVVKMNSIKMTMMNNGLKLLKNCHKALSAAVAHKNAQDKK